MTTTMRILGWKSCGLRCPDHEIDCRDENGNPFPATLIQMPNGTGKTTTLTLLRAALSGAAQAWSPDDVRKFCKKSAPSERGSFEIKLLVNDKRLTILLEFNFDSGEIQYFTTRTRGKEAGFDPPAAAMRFMAEEFVNFYVFDGELAENLLEKNHTHAEQAVERLFQIHLLKTMKERVVDYWRESTKNFSVKTDKGVTQRLNLLQRWKNRLDEVLTEKSKLETQRSSLLNEVQDVQNKHEHEIAKHKNIELKIRIAEKKIDDLRLELAAQSRVVLENMRDPQAIGPVYSELMSGLKSGLDRVQLPEGAAREFFQELAEEPECICGRPIDSEVRDVIRQRSYRYLGSENISLLNAMKTSISDALIETNENSVAGLSAKVDKLVHIRGVELQLAQNRLDELVAEAERMNPSIRRLRLRIDDLKAKLQAIDRSLKKFQGYDQHISFDKIGKENPRRVCAIATIEEVIQLLQEMVEETTRIRHLRECRDRLERILDHAHDLARSSIISEIRDEANRKIVELMPDSSIRIESIDGCLNLRGQTGASVGETLSVGYSFLSTLFHRANEHSLPFVVDSPANPIDLSVRSRVGKLVPKLTGQFIAFVISSERERFVSSLRDASDSKIQYITLFRSGSKKFESTARADDSCVKSLDGFRVTGVNFFDQFQVDSEDS